MKFNVYYEIHGPEGYREFGILDVELPDMSLGWAANIKRAKDAAYPRILAMLKPGEHAPRDKVMLMMTD